MSAGALQRYAFRSVALLVRAASAALGAGRTAVPCRSRARGHWWASQRSDAVTRVRLESSARTPGPRIAARAAAPYGGLLALQRGAGNRAVSGLLRVQRCGPAKTDCDCLPEERDRAEGAAVQRLTAEEKGENLKSARYAGEPRLEAVFDNNPPMRFGERGEAVARVQKGLVDD